MGELFDNFVNANSLYKAFLLSKRNSIWKESVQRYESNLLLNIYDSQKSVNYQLSKAVWLPSQYQ